MMDQSNTNFTIDKISTMSLGEFRNLLNNALSVPNGHTESQCSSDSPRSQGSVDSCKNPSKANKSTPTKSAYSYRSVSAGRNQSNKPAIAAKPNIASSQNKSDSTVGTPRSHSAVRSSGYGQVRSSGYGQVKSSGYGQERPKTPNSMLRSRSNTSSVSDSSYTNQSNSRSNFASRSSSHSSIQSYESTDDGRNSLGTDYGEQTTKVLTPSSVDSDYSFRGSSCTNSDYTRSNSYTPCSLTDEKIRLEQLRSSIRANSEPKESISSVSSDIQNAYGVPEEKPINVGYASFSYEKEDEVKEVDEIGSEIINSRSEARCRTVPSTPEKETQPSNMRAQTPTGRRTPSFLPRPVTPKTSRKLSLPQNDESSAQNEKKSSARPPTPKKSTIMARAHTPVRASDKSKEQTYREIFQKRSTTPGPGSTSSTDSRSYGRSMTPGPYLQKTSTLRATSSTTDRTRLNEALEQKKETTLSVYNGGTNNSDISSASNRTQVIDRKTLTKQKSESDAVIVVNVNRSEGRHSISVQGESGPRQTPVKTKVLARARTEDSRARQGSRTTPSTPRQRPQSVEPRQLISNRTGTNKGALSVKQNETDGQRRGSYDRTNEWVQSAVEQTKVKKPKVTKAYDPRMRRAMTPNSFDMRIDKEAEEPRSLEEIKAALSLPINGITNLNTEELEAPPEDPEMYATMEKLFHELRQQELKNSVNETPGSNTSGSKAGRTKSKSSKSNSTNNDEEMSVDSNKNLKHKTYSTSTRSSSNMTSPMVQRSTKVNSEAIKRSRPQSASRASSVSSSSNTRSVTENYSTPRRSSSRTVSQSSAGTPNSTRPSSPSPALVTKRPPSPRTAGQPPRPASPRVSAQPPRPASPRVNAQPRPSSPRVTPQPPRPASPRVNSNLNNRPSSPSPLRTPDSSRATTPSRPQPPRPASTPPRSYQPISRVSSKSSEESDSAFEKENRDESGNLVSKIKEIIKVKPRKAKADDTKSKTRIPAPKSLASIGKSQSFSNLCNLSQSLTIPSEEKSNGYNYEEPETPYNSDYINGGLNSTMPVKVESATPKWNTPLTTGRSSLIRKESMEKNKNSNKLVRAVSVERNLGLNGTYQYFDEGEYV